MNKALCAWGQSEGPPYALICLRCGRAYTSKYPPERTRLLCKKRPGSENPGTELKKLIPWFINLKVPNAVCDTCNERADEMDRNGIEWCEASQDVIADWLMQSYDERGMTLTDFLPAGVKFLGPLVSHLPHRAIAERGARWMVRRAIKNAKANATPNPNQDNGVGNLNGQQQCHDQPMEYVSLNRLMDDIRNVLLPQIPKNVAGVAGVVRSGMIPASVVASMIHRPLYEISRQNGVRLCGHGSRMDAEELDDGVLLVIDDSSWSGMAASYVREACREWDAVYAAIYPRRSTVHLFDLHARPLEWHLFEWNLFNCTFTQVFGLDLDGVICPNLPASCDEEDATYAKEITNAKPLYLPRMVEIPLIATARPERMRAITETWLTSWGVRVKELLMWPGRLDERDFESVCRWKADAYASRDLALYVESEPSLAEQIHQISGKPVLCPSNETIYQRRPG